jgi:hypothetical protein
MHRKLLSVIVIAIAAAVLFVPGSSYAIKFQGDGWVGHHYANGQATNEYYLILDPDMNINTDTLRLKGFKFDDGAAERDFSQLTGNAGNAGITWLGIDTSTSKIFRKLERKAYKRSMKMLNKGMLGSEQERQDWADSFVNENLAKKTFKVVFRDENGKKYKGRISLASFENPVGEGTPTNDVAPVPEPGTLILLGAGMLGVATVRRKMKK